MRVQMLDVGSVGVSVGTAELGRANQLVVYELMDVALVEHLPGLVCRPIGVDIPAQDERVRGVGARYNPGVAQVVGPYYPYAGPQGLQTRIEPAGVEADVVGAQEQKWGNRRAIPQVHLLGVVAWRASRPVGD